MAISQREVKPGLENQVVYWQKSQAETCPDMLVSETLREALWFEMNPRPCLVKRLPYGMRSLFNWGQGLSSINSESL